MSTLIMLSTLLIFMWSLKYNGACAPPVVPTTNTTVAQPPGVPTILSKPIDVKQEAVNVNLFVSKKDMDGIAKLMAAKTNEQRQRIKVEYQQEYAHSLEEDVAGKTKKTFERLMEALLQPLPEFMARMINWSLNENKNWLYVSILSTSSGELIKQISDAYYAAFKKQLMDELTMKLNDVDGSRFLTSVVNYMAGNNTNENWPGPRPDTTKVAENLVKTQISYIPDRQGFCSAQENPNLLDLLSKSSFAQIQAVVNAYQTKTTQSAETRIRNFCKGDLIESYSRVVRYAVDPVRYWTTEIYESMSTKHTDDRALTLAILYRSEIDLATIRDTFNDNYHNILVNFIQEHCSGTYMNVMLQIVNGN